MTPPSNRSSDILIVGAGIAGLGAARRLAQAGRRVRLIDKGRGPGGRCATRRWGSLRVDHGAQYFTARSPGFRSLAARWVEEGVCREWCRRLHVWSPEGLRPELVEETRWVGIGGMSSIAKALAAGLDVSTGIRVTRLTRTADGWLVVCDPPRIETARIVVLTPPLPQTVSLLQDSGIPVAPALRRLCYEPCLALGIRVRVEPPPWQGIRFEDHPVLGWLADDTDRRGEAAKEGGRVWMAHANGSFSRSHQDGNPDEAADRIEAAVLEVLGEAGEIEVQERFFHRWRYARAMYEGGAEWVSGWLTRPVSESLWVAGDGLVGSRVESAYESGIRVAELILKSD